MEVWIVRTEVNGYKNIYKVFDTEKKARECAENMPWQFDRHTIWIEQHHVE